MGKEINLMKNIKDVTNYIFSANTSLLKKPDEEFKVEIKVVEATASIADNILNLAHTNPDIFEYEAKNWASSGNTYPQLRKTFNIFDNTVKNYVFNFETEFEESIDEYLDSIITLAKEKQVFGEDISVYDLYEPNLTDATKKAIDNVNKYIASVTKEDVITAIRLHLGLEEPTIDKAMLRSLRVLTIVGEVIADFEFDNIPSIIIFGNVLKNCSEGLESSDSKLEKVKANAEAYNFISSSIEDIDSKVITSEEDKELIEEFLNASENESNKYVIGLLRRLIK